MAPENNTPQHWLWLSLQTISYDTSMKATAVLVFL